MTMQFDMSDIQAWEYVNYIAYTVSESDLVSDIILTCILKAVAYESDHDQPITEGDINMFLNKLRNDYKISITEHYSRQWTKVYRFCNNV